jgi:hypothetical protein
MSKIENSKYFWENKINVLYNKLKNPLKDQQYILSKNPLKDRLHNLYKCYFIFITKEHLMMSYLKCG